MLITDFHGKKFTLINVVAGVDKKPKKLDEIDKKQIVMVYT